MNTNDKLNAFKSMKTALKSINNKIDVNFEDIKNGSCSEFLKIYHYVFLNYSPHIASEIVNKHNLELTHKTDKYFIDGIYKLFRDMLNYTPKINKEQFIQNGFMVAKCNMCADVIELVRLKAKAIHPTATGNSAIGFPNKLTIKTSLSASSALNNVCTNLKESHNPIEEPTYDDKIISPKLNNKIIKANLSIKSSLMQTHLKNQPQPRITLKKSHSARETTPYFGKSKQTEKEVNIATSTSTDSKVIVESLVDTHLQTINQTLIDINNRLISFDKRLNVIEEEIHHRHPSKSSSVSSISIENEICMNTETISKLQKKIENLVARFDLIENDNKLIKQNQLNLNNIMRNMNNLQMEENNDSETTLNDYETPGNSFLNISGTNMLNDSNGISNQFIAQSSKRDSGRVVQGVIQMNTTPTLNNKCIDLGNLTYHSNDSTPTLTDQLLNKSNNDSRNGLNDVMRAKQLVIRATHLNEAFSTSLKT